MEKDTEPEIKYINMCSTVLLLKNINFENVLRFPFLDRPSDYQLIKALSRLKLLGALTTTGDLTVIGKQLAKFPLDPSWGKFLINCNRFGCLEEGLTITAMLSIEDVFLIPSKESLKNRAESIRKTFFSNFGDPLMSLNIWTEFKNSLDRKEFCRDNFLNSRNMKRAISVRQQLSFIAEKEFPKRKMTTNVIRSIRKSIAHTFFFNSARKTIHQRGQNAEYKAIDSKIKDRLSIHVGSCMHETNHRWVIFNGVTYTSRPFMHGITTIKFNWIENLLSTINKIDINQLTKGTLKELQKERNLDGIRKKLKMETDITLKSYNRRSIEMLSIIPKKKIGNIWEKDRKKNATKAKQRYLLRIKELEKKK